ncbi:MAG TPA: carboxypeptidase-like regulatory domain-containing protein, partial [Gemmatimonadaceae bacterium]
MTRLTRASVAAMVTCVAGLAHAQVIHGRVLLPDSTPAAGSMVTATTSGGGTARTIASRTGAYRLTLSRTGRYEIRALRIGFIPTVVRAVDVAAGEDRTIDIVLTSQPVRLATLNVDARDNCGMRGPEATAFLQLWEQTRAALAATSLVETRGSLDMRVVRLDGTVEIDGSHAKVDSAGARETISSRPFATTPAETLATAGYVRQRRDGTVVFDVPGADAFLSDAFVATHCFSVEDPPGDHRDWIGIGFRPAENPDTTTDIFGVMWLDRATAELRRLEFGYVNVIFFPQRICDHT